jgi:hypothetical protein
MDGDERDGESAVGAQGSVSVADALADLAFAAGGAVIGGLGTWAAVAGKFGRLESRVTNVESVAAAAAGLGRLEERVDNIEETAKRLENKIDVNQERTEQQMAGRHKENKELLTENKDLVMQLNRRLDDVIIVDRRKASREGKDA